MPLGGTPNADICSFECLLKKALQGAPGAAGPKSVEDLGPGAVDPGREAG